MSTNGWTKLFGTIVTSSIWVEDNTTLRVWIAMLATADAQGMVVGTIPGFANLARVTVAEMRAAIKILESPDPDSRTRDHEGRRIEAVPGGWRLLNYATYRERGQAKEGSRAPYMRAYRAAKGQATTGADASTGGKQEPARQPPRAEPVRRVQCSRKDHLFCGRHFHVSYAQQARLEEGLPETFVAGFNFRDAYARWDREKPEFDNLLKFLREKIQAEASGNGGGDLYDRLPHAYECPTCSEIHEGTREQMQKRECLNAGRNKQ